MKRILEAIKKRCLLKELYYNHFKHNIKRTKGSNLVIFKHSKILIEKEAKIFLTGKLYIGTPCAHDNNGLTTLSLIGNSTLNCNGGIMWSGSSINLINGEISLGYFNLNYNSVLRAYKKIEIGSNVMIARNVIISDSDSHFIVVHGDKKDNTGEIQIGNNVWICSNSVVLKGTVIEDNVVVAANTLISNKTIKKNILVKNKQQPDYTNIDGWSK